MEGGPVSETLWGRRPPPITGPDAAPLGRWEPTSRADLTAARRQLASTLHDGRRASIEEGAVERLLLAFEELVSNGLRHGRAPVQATITADGTYWLLEVSDTATDRPPIPAVDRDAADGGLGLYLVARICGAHGWYTTDGRKTTWARVDRTRTEAPRNVWQASPGTHGEHPHRRHDR
jgi:anti-sigma regulatory factor (Ser/Thr protein kinase)